MNENTFISQRIHTRIKYNPLTTSCHLVCLTPQSPCTQVANTLGSSPEYEPDRSKTPTKVFPDVRAIDPDEVFTHGAVNKYLSLDDSGWYVDGKAISTVWKNGTDYTIDTTETQDRFTLTVLKNIPASSKAVLRFKGKFLDWRTGAIYAVESDEMPLTTTDKGTDAISCSVDKSSIIYDPFTDGLLLYEYKVARGISVQGKREDYIDGKCYEQTVNILLNSGSSQLTALPTGMTMRLVAMGTDTDITAKSTANPEVMAFSFQSVTFDMRMIDQAQYEVQFLKDGKIICRAAIGLTNTLTMPNVNSTPLRAADISKSGEVYPNSVVINTDLGASDYPELYYFLKWYTQAKFNAGTDAKPDWQYAEKKEWQHGENMLAAVEDLGLGVTKDDNMFDVFFSADPHPIKKLLTLADGTYLTDKNGNPLIG